MAENAQTIKYDLIEAAGQKVLFTPLRIDRHTVPNGFYCYDLRHGDDDGIAQTIENSVYVNHFGSILCVEPFDFGDKDYIKLEDSVNFLSVPEITLEEFMEGDIEAPLSKIRVLIVEPEKAPYVSTIVNSLEGLQAIVNGSIEYVELDANTGLYCNEEGKLLGLKGNRDINGDIIAGTFLICGDNGYGDNISLTDEKIAIYSERFAEPEYYTDEDLQDAIFCEIKSYNNLDDLLNDFMGNKEDEEDMEL